MIAGISGIVRTAVRGPGRDWRIAFVSGLVVAGLGATLSGHADAAAGLDTTGWPRLAIAGLLVGIGTSLANGCTSGHGVCGLARGSRRSIVAVPVFMGTAILTVALVRILGQAAG